MRITELRLLAFGPFTGRILDLSAGGQGLHVVFGRNEAGKSSALRALHALLYGIPAQTQDAFLHPYDGLRLGGRLRLSAGDEIEFVRRKTRANKGALLAPDGTRMDDHSLDRFLGGVGADQFHLFWGIDHQRLVEGGKDMLAGRGDLAETLFAAGSGISNLNSLRKQLDAESEALFAPRGRNQRIGQGVSQLREIRSAQRDLTVSAEAWALQERALQDAENRLVELTDRATDLSRQKSRIERLKRVLPLVAELNEVRKRATALTDCVVLAADFPKRRQDAEGALRLAEQQHDTLLRDSRETEDVLNKLGAPPLLAAEADVVAKLHQGVGEYRKGLADRPGLIGRCREQRTLAERLLKELRPDLDIQSVETLRAFGGRRARIQKLAAEQERLDERLQAAHRAKRDAGEQIEKLTKEGSSLPPQLDPEKLAEAIEEVRRRGNVEAEAEKLNHAAKKDALVCDVAMEKLQIPKALEAQLPKLRVPTAAAISKFERDSQRLEGDSRTEKAEHQRIEKRTRELDAKIETLRTKKAVPTAEDLVAARERRDSAFQLLRGQWEQGRDVTSEVCGLLGDGELMDLYPIAVQRADEVADRLRSEADRVAELAQLMEERRDLAVELKAVNAGARLREEEAEQHAAAWRELWKPVLPSPPQIADGRAWHDDLGGLVVRFEALEETRQQQTELGDWVERKKANLCGAMVELGSVLPAGTLVEVLAAGDKLRLLVERENLARSEHIRRESEAADAIRRAETAIRNATVDLQSWQQKWSDAVAGLVPGATLLPDDALVAIDRVERIFRALDDSSGFEARVAGIDRDSAAFRGDVAVLAQRLGEQASLDDGAEDTWVEQLQKRLSAVLQEDSQRQEANKRLIRLRSDLAQNKEKVLVGQALVSALHAEAQWEGDLATAEQRSSDLLRCREELARIQKEIVRHGDGLSLADLEAEASTADRDTIAAQLSQLDADFSEVEKQLSEVRDARATAQAEIRRLQGPSAASEKAELFQSTLAQLREDVIRYARLRLAATLLTRRMDDYRRKNQAPLLRRAGEIFHALVLGAFDSLEADVDDDRPILVGVRPDGQRVPTHGMSDGTVDQLFLALRLAAVEASCATGEPMPFVVDDILIQFDDERSAAAVEALAKGAARTQVVLFTHHGRVRECAESLSATSEVFVHQL